MLSSFAQKNTVKYTLPDSSLSVQNLNTWLNQLILDYKDKIIIPDLDTSLIWGELIALNYVESGDALIAAQAIRNNMIVVTRNVKHFEPFSVKVINPFKDSL